MNWLAPHGLFEVKSIPRHLHLNAAWKLEQREIRIIVSIEVVMSPFLYLVKGRD